MPSKGTKRVVWCDWSVNLFREIKSGRGQFEEGAFRAFVQSPRGSKESERGLGHIAAVIKGELKAQGRMRKDQNPSLSADQVTLWTETAYGPVEIYRGRKVKEADFRQPEPVPETFANPRGWRGRRVSVVSGQESLF